MPHMEEELLSFTRQLDRNRAELMREFDELRKDKERLDWLQSSDLTLNHWEEGPVWCKKGLWTIREYIDAEMKGESL